MSSATDQLTRERLREAIELLESIAADRTVLAGVPDEERKRLLQAVAHVYSPDRVERRRMAKIVDAQRKAARVKGDQGVLQRPASAVCVASRCFIRRTCSRPSRSQTDSSLETSTTPTAQSPSQPKPAQSPEPSPEPRAAALLRLQAEVHASSITSTTSSVPPCAEFNFAQAHRAGRPARPRGAAHRRPREDRLPGRAQAAALRARTSSSPRAFRATRRRATRASPTFAEWGDRLEIFGLDLRHTPSVEAFCRELLATRTRLDFIVNNACQTVRRPPDFYAHMMAGETAALHDMPEHVRKLLGAYEGLRGYHMLPEGEPDRSAALTQATGRRCRRAGTDARGAAVAGAAAARRSCAAQKDLFPRGTARSGSAAGRPARAQLVAAAARTKCRRWSCSRCSWSTPSRRSSSTRASSR